jgi:hypothetical protein
MGRLYSMYLEVSILFTDPQMTVYTFHLFSFLLLFEVKVRDINV